LLCIVQFGYTSSDQLELIMRISEAKAYFGSQVRIGKAIKLGKSSINLFKDKGGIPFGYQCAIEELTNGKLIANREHDPDNVFYIPENQAKAA
jgi:hypothetical protein